MSKTLAQTLTQQQQQLFAAETAYLKAKKDYRKAKKAWQDWQESNKGVTERGNGQNYEEPKPTSEGVAIGYRSLSPELQDCLTKLNCFERNFYHPHTGHLRWLTDRLDAIEAMLRLNIGDDPNQEQVPTVLFGTDPRRSGKTIDTRPIEPNTGLIEGTGDDSKPWSEPSQESKACALAAAKRGFVRTFSQLEEEAVYLKRQ
jgi:hypothetical protein